MALISQPGSDYQIVSISLDAGYTRDLILMLIDVHAVLDHLYLDGTLSRAERQALDSIPAQPARLRTSQQQSRRQLLTRRSPAPPGARGQIKEELLPRHHRMRGPIKGEQWGQLGLTRPEGAICGFTEGGCAGRDGPKRRGTRPPRVSALGQESAAGRFRAVGPGYPPAHRVRGVVGPDEVQQLGGAIRAQRLPVVPALGYPYIRAGCSIR